MLVVIYIINNGQMYRFVLSCDEYICLKYIYRRIDYVYYPKADTK